MRQDEDTAGMIPRAVEQVFRVAEEMRGKGWEYKIEGQFLEIVCFFSRIVMASLLTFSLSTMKQSTTSLVKGNLIRRNMR